MTKIKSLALAVLALALVGCTSTIGNNVVNDKGEIVGDKLDWPKIEDATQEEGIFPNLSNLEHIRKGMSKKELYYLIERPHFSEMNGAREWNYIMKFKRYDGSVKVCQYKILFDEDQKAQSFFWYPKGCNEKEVEKKTIASDDIFPVVPALIPSAEALFASNKSSISQIKGEGVKKLDEVIKSVSNKKANAKIHLIGHTDYRGTEAYNMELSKKRVLSVREYLIKNGVDKKSISYEYKGESEPVKQCSKSLKKQELIKCLQPNRRVNVEITRDYVNPR